MDSHISWDSLHKQNQLSFDPQSKDYGFCIEITISDVLGCLPVQLDTVISQARATLGALVLQRSTFSGISSKITNISSCLPLVNHILLAIKRKKKSMDAIILS